MFQELRIDKQKLKWALVSLLGLILIFEIIRDSSRAGDFQGYINAGNSILAGLDIYIDPLNTWPPLFSILSVPLTIFDAISPYGIRLVWLCLSLLAMWRIVNLSTQLVYDRKLSWNKQGNYLSMVDPIVLIPLLLSFRFLLDNLSNIQINIFMLWICIEAYHLTIKKHDWKAAILMSIGICMKVYPLLLLLYFLYKRNISIVCKACVCIIILHLIAGILLGWDLLVEYYHHWYSVVNPKSMMANLKNQSLFGMMLRLLSEENPTHGMYINVLSLPKEIVKYITYAVVGLASIAPAIWFRSKFRWGKDHRQLIELAIVCVVIPLLSPVAWKAFFIFSWFPIFLIFGLSYQKEGIFYNRLRMLFYFSMFLLIASADMFLGKYLSNWAESLSVLTIASLLLAIILLILYFREESILVINNKRV